MVSIGDTKINRMSSLHSEMQSIAGTRYQRNNYNRASESVTIGV